MMARARYRASCRSGPASWSRWRRLATWLGVTRACARSSRIRSGFRGSTRRLRQPNSHHFRYGTVCSPSPACRQANGAARGRRMQLSDCTRNSNEGSKHRRCYRLQILPQCCSRGCLHQARSTCAKSMAGRRSPPAAPSACSAPCVCAREAHAFVCSTAAPSTLRTFHPWRQRLRLGCWRRLGEAPSPHERVALESFELGNSYTAAPSGPTACASTAP